MTSSSMWRNAALKVIGEVEAANPGASEADLEKLISQAYPFGERRMHPYKMWLDAVSDSREVRRRRKAWKAGTW